MDTETVTRTIQLILAPVVMVSACSILVGGLLAHYAEINLRIRTLAHERLDLLRSAKDERNPLVIERLAEIDLQLPEILGRHGLVHHSLLAAYVSILILVATMCVSALSAAITLDWLVTSILVLFVAGILALLVSVVFVAIEVSTSRRAVTFEVRRVLRLSHNGSRRA